MALRGVKEHPSRRRFLAKCAIVLIALGAALVPYLPAGPDLYVHLLWSWQVMRCLAVGALPVWLPDLNAGFGSPGVRLYSPLGPVLEGALGLGLGNAGAALRVLPILVWGGFMLVVRRRRAAAGAGEWALLAAAPVVVHSLLGRGAWSEFLAVPLLWWLVDVAFEGDVAPVRDGFVLAALWLLHAPTTLMALLLMGTGCALVRSRRCALRAALAVLVGAGLTAWHWLPLASEMRLTDRAALTGGIFEAARNVLGSPSAHAPEESLWLGWCAVTLLAGAAVGRWWRIDPARTAALVAAVALASPVATALYRPPSPLAILQFPWRWLLPAAVLAALPARRALGSAAGKVGAALALVPLVVFPFGRFVRDPGLTAATSRQDAGVRVYSLLGGNPLLVDAAQNRPVSYRMLAANLRLFGDREILLDPGAGAASVVRWRPLERRVALDLNRPAVVSLRLLAYPTWRANLDGGAVPARDATGVIAVGVPAGRHELSVRWSGNPLAAVGQAAAGATLLALAWSRHRRWRTSREAPSDAP